MTGKELIKYIEDWAPKEAAWEKDNVGLQVGSLERPIKNVMLCLELTNGVIKQSLKDNCNFIFSHHPLMFQPLKKIDTARDKNSQMIEKLIKKNLTLYSAHTNLDFTKGGVSFQLAKKLRLKEIDFLVNHNSNQFKIVVFIPEKNVELFSKEIFNCGAGVIGEYSNCSFRINGEGTFKGSSKTKPYLGKKEKKEIVKEIRLEFVVEKSKLNQVISAIKNNHPYEQPAYDIYTLNNSDINYGAGAFGKLEKPLKTKEFLDNVYKNLNLKNFRYVNGNSKVIKKVAVCGGSCSELIDAAISKNADAFVTADIKYHAFHDAADKILLIDAGHYETEIHILNEVQKRMKNFFVNEKKIKVFKYKGSTNPVVFYNN